MLYRCSNILILNEYVLYLWTWINDNLFNWSVGNTVDPHFTCVALWISADQRYEYVFTIFDQGLYRFARRNTSLDCHLSNWSLDVLDHTGHSVSFFYAVLPFSGEPSVTHNVHLFSSNRVMCPVHQCIPLLILPMSLWCATDASSYDRAFLSAHVSLPHTCPSSGFPFEGVVILIYLSLRSTATFVKKINWSLLLAFSLHFSSSSAFLRSLFAQSSNVRCDLHRFLQPSCLFVSDIFGNISSFILTTCPVHFIRLLTILPTIHYFVPTSSHKKM